MGAQAVRVFPIFFGVWICLGLFSAGFFLLNNNAALKRRVWTPFSIGVALLFLTFVGLMGFPLATFFIAVPALAVITFLNIRGVKFCDACGKTTMSRNPFAPPRFCSRCGAKLPGGDD